jgi:hypothetical protein
MKKSEIISLKKMEIEHAPSGKFFIEIYGKDVKKLKIRSVLFYGESGWISTSQQNANFDSLFFSLVRKGRIDIPSDFETCYKCGGSGNVGYQRDGGVCYNCEGLGYKFKN